MSRGGPSPYYLEAAVGQRWKGRLLPLLRTLVGEARQDIGKFKWRILPRGAVVAVKITDEEYVRPQLRIKRKAEEELTEKQYQAWEREVAVFLDQFAMVEVDGQTPCRIPGRAVFRLTPATAEQGPDVQFVGLRSGEIRPGKAKCGQCGTEVTWWASGGIQGQRCPACVKEQRTKPKETPTA